MTRDREEELLTETFAQLRADDVAPSDDLFDRIMMDADNVLAAASPYERPKATIGLRFLDAIGGWPSLGGLAAATFAGLWIGVMQPAALGDLSASFWGNTYAVPLLESDVFAGLEG